MTNYRDNYIKKYGPIPAGHEIHHILPIRLGGTDDVDNLKSVIRSEHAIAHKKLYEDFGDIKDLCAFYMLSGTFDRKSFSSIGGKIGGAKTYEEKIGIHGGTKDQRKKWARMGGVIGGVVQANLELGFHQYNKNPELHREWAKKGGESSIFTKKYAELHGISEEERINSQSKRGKRGGPKNKGFVWINDGKICIKYTIKMQENKSVDDYILENPTFMRGRTDVGKFVTCPHCNKKGKLAGLSQYHFDNCFKLTGVKIKKKKQLIKQCSVCKINAASSTITRYHNSRCKGIRNED